MKGHSGEVSDGNEDMLSEMRGKAILAIKCQRTWLNCVHVPVLREGRASSNETGYLAEEISKQSIERVAWFFLTAYSKI